MEAAATRAFAVVVSGLLGLAIGSFLNVVVYRLPRGESLSRPPSHCPVCGARLGPLENVPLASWLALRGRCRHCRAPISVRYPLVELATAALFVALAVALPSVDPLAPLDALVALTIVVAAVDLDDEPVPVVLGVLAAVAAATLVAVSFADETTGRLEWAAIGVGAAGAAWLLHRAGGRPAGPDGFPSLSWCAAWGWSAGWVARGGGVAVGVALAVLTVVNWARPATIARRTAAIAAAVTVATVIGGAIATR